jgi:formamidopyrimidine-DNA glycosylase
MPELPEVETTRRSLEPDLLGRRIMHVAVRERRLRWPVPDEFERELTGANVISLGRRAKYLLMTTDRGTAIVHLGMSGSLTLTRTARPPLKHDHVDIILDNGGMLRYHDPRRFGSIHWCRSFPENHMLLAGLAPEPLSEAFDGPYLHGITRRRSAAIKQVIMNGSLVTGVGNIYASEALHHAGINPRTPARRLSLARCTRLVASVRHTLARAIAAGGSTLRDYVDGSGNPGYFQMESAVYGRNGRGCPRCGTTVRMIRQGQRATYFCPGCQH